MEIFPFSHFLSTALDGADATPVPRNDQSEHSTPPATVTSSGMGMRPQAVLLIHNSRLLLAILRKEALFFPGIAKLIQRKPRTC